jgi:hypothetical protein
VGVAHATANFGGKLTVRSLFDGPKLSSEEKSWLSRHDPPKFFLPFSEWRERARAPHSSEGYEKYVDAWAAQLTDGDSSIRTGLGNEQVAKAISAKLKNINRFGLDLRPPFKVRIEGKFIRTVTMHGGVNIGLKNCAIQRIVCGNQDGPSRLSMTNCRVGSLVIEPKSLRFFEIKGGGIEDLQSPLTSEHGPFVGSVNIVSAYFSPKIENAQAFRNLRHHLTSLHNQEAASVFHSAEMRALFNEQGLLDRFFNLLYRFVSDYGNSTVRPFSWFLLFAALNFFLFFITDGAVASAGSEAVGWQHLLLDESTFGAALRAGTITLTQILNPLGIFGHRSLLIANSLGLVVANAGLCLFATVSLAFFILALRRRFRLALN